MKETNYISMKQLEREILKLAGMKNQLLKRRNKMKDQPKVLYVGSCPLCQIPQKRPEGTTLYYGYCFEPISEDYNLSRIGNYSEGLLEIKNQIEKYSAAIIHAWSDECPHVGEAEGFTLIDMARQRSSLPIIGVDDNSLYKISALEHGANLFMSKQELFCKGKEELQKLINERK